jgi:hypothetical protein
MLYAIRGSLVIVALAAVVPIVLVKEAQAGKRDCCCRACRCPCQRCVCPRPAVPAVPAVPQTSYQPILETHYAQQPVLQQRDVLATEYRTEPVTESVPSTIYENVMVDEGSYQTVWVPRLTTRAVAKTIYQTQTSYRTVPYQVSRRVSEYAWQTVPYQSVRYVPAGNAVAWTGAPGYAYAPPPWPGTLAAAPPILPAPATAIASNPLPSSTLGPALDPRFSAATPITPRAASTSGALDGYEPSDSRTALRGPSLFVPAPSAAQVWRTPRSSVVR